MRAIRNAFTMLELIFVIVVMGIIGTIGAEIFRSTYDTFMSSNINNKLQVETELALKQIANRMQYRFKDSVIARTTRGGSFVGLSSASVSSTYTAVEWVGYDIDGWQGRWDSTDGFNRPAWSGFIDLDANDVAAPIGTIDDPNLLITPETDTTLVNNIISDVRAGSTTIADSAIFFTGANTDIQTGYGWNGTALVDQNGSSAHPINAHGAFSDAFISGNGDDFTDIDVYEQYKLAWTAYALELYDVDGDGKDDELLLYHDYQPWKGEQYHTAGTASLLMDNVQTFKVQAIGDIIKVQLCIDNNATGNIPANQIYSLCKEKVIF